MSKQNLLRKFSSFGTLHFLHYSTVFMVALIFLFFQAFCSFSTMQIFLRISWIPYMYSYLPAHINRYERGIFFIKIRVIFFRVEAIIINKIGIKVDKWFLLFTPQLETRRFYVFKIYQRNFNSVCVLPFLFLKSPWKRANYSHDNMGHQTIFEEQANKFGILDSRPLEASYRLPHFTLPGI